MREITRASDLKLRLESSELYHYKNDPPETHKLVENRDYTEKVRIVRSKMMNFLKTQAKK